MLNCLHYIALGTYSYLKIIASAISSFSGGEGRNIAPVNLRCFGDILKMNFQDTNKYAGVISTSGLTQMLNEHNLKFEATLTAPSQQSRGAKKDAALSKECVVRIVVYGQASERIAVGKAFSKAKLYFQQPCITEYDRKMVYSNPHYLVRPGSKMPELSTLVIDSDTRSTADASKLEEINKNWLTKLFDTANDDGIRVQVLQSPRLFSRLKECVNLHPYRFGTNRHSHQLVALEMMLEKECPILDAPLFPSLWEPQPNQQGVKRLVSDLYGTSKNRYLRIAKLSP